MSGFRPASARRRGAFDVLSASQASIRSGMKSKRRGDRSKANGRSSRHVHSSLAANRPDQPVAERR